LLKRYQRQELSPVEVTEMILGRIERLNPSLTAFITVTPERALEDARAAERAYSNGSAGPLAGIPTSIKDLVATKGIRTTRGSLLHKDYVPDANPVFVQRLYDAGIVMLGKTNTPEGGWKGDSGNRLVGPTHNPWRHGRTAGGSSGGAAAAIAAGLGPLAQGGDGAGSIRIPASFSGIFGLKPSFGRVPYPGGSPSTQLAHTGPMTRTVRDAALMLDVMVGADPTDRYSLDTHGSFLKQVEGGIAGLKVAWSPELGFAEVEPEVAEIAARAAARFAELGCEVVEATPDAPDPWPYIDVLFAIGQAVSAEQLERVRDQVDQGRLKIMERALGWSANDVRAAVSGREEYYQRIKRFMDEYDLLLTPTTPLPAFVAGEDYPAEINGKSMTYLGWTPFTYPFNLTGHPAATVPCGFTSDGLPIGLQIVGRWRDDATVLRASAAFEELAPWSDKLPPVD
jgi:aspartyl-tRNA(Asn)/glutamyl-tRNA(Gln) amidotransferase subunit A